VCVCVKFRRRLASDKIFSIFLLLSAIAIAERRHRVRTLARAGKRRPHEQPRAPKKK
jgi:hypothetical protein